MPASVPAKQQTHLSQSSEITTAASVRSVRLPTETPDLSRVKRFNTLAAKEQRRGDKLKWHNRAMAEMWRVMGWGEYPGDTQQGRLV